MKTTTLAIIISILAFTFSCKETKHDDKQTKTFNIENAADNFTAFLKIRASLDTTVESVYWWTGVVYASLPEQKVVALFNFEGINVARLRRIENGYRMLTREASVYKDLKTNEIIETWANPFTNKNVAVVQVWNDPVNQSFINKGDWKVPYLLKDNMLSLYADINLFYPNPLSPELYPKATSEKMYKSTEMFNFFADYAETSKTENNSVEAFITWTRVGQWLPWMQMGETKGELIYQCRGKKLINGFAEIPQNFRNYITSKHPEYQHAPQADTTRNETSWTYFKKLVDAGLYKFAE